MGGVRFFRAGLVCAEDAITQGHQLRCLEHAERHFVPLVGADTDGKSSRPALGQGFRNAIEDFAVNEDIIAIVGKEIIEHVIHSGGVDAHRLFVQGLFNHGLRAMSHDCAYIR